MPSPLELASLAMEQVVGTFGTGVSVVLNGQIASAPLENPTSALSWLLRSRHVSRCSGQALAGRRSVGRPKIPLLATRCSLRSSGPPRCRVVAGPVMRNRDYSMWKCLCWSILRSRVETR